MGDRLLTYDQLIAEMAYARDFIIMFIVMIFVVWVFMEMRFSFLEHRWRKEEHKKRMEEFSERSDNEN